jgi:hypothetical protein
MGPARLLIVRLEQLGYRVTELRYPPGRIVLEMS